MSKAGFILKEDLVCGIDGTRYEMKNDCLDCPMSEYTEKTKFIDLAAQQSNIRKSIDISIKFRPWSVHNGSEVKELKINYLVLLRLNIP